MPSEQKHKILKLWIRFLSSNFDRRDFTKELYHYLMNAGGFIAHNDIFGFWEEYFERGADKIRFLEHFDLKKMRGNYLCEINLNGDYGDLNQAMVEEAAKFLPVLYAGAQNEQKQLDLAVAQQLLARHGLTLNEVVKPLAGNQAATGRTAIAGTQISLF